MMASVLTMDDLESIIDSTAHPVFITVDVAKLPIAHAARTYLQAQEIRERHLQYGGVMIGLSAETVAKIRRGEIQEILL